MEHVKTFSPLHWPSFRFLIKTNTSPQASTPRTSLTSAFVKYRKPSESSVNHNSWNYRIHHHNQLCPRCWAQSLFYSHIAWAVIVLNTKNGNSLKLMQLAFAWSLFSTNIYWAQNLIQLSKRWIHIVIDMPNRRLSFIVAK